MNEEKRTVANVVRLKPNIDEKLRKIAKKEDRTLVAIIERALLDYFKANKL